MSARWLTGRRTMVSLARVGRALRSTEQINEEGLPPGGIGVRSGARQSRLVDVGGEEPSETAKKLRHIANLLENAGAPCSEELAVAWITPFSDDPDPSHVVEQCLNAGWRDPWLLGAAVSIFGDLENALLGMESIGATTGSLYSLDLVRRLLEAREHLTLLLSVGCSRNPQQSQGPAPTRRGQRAFPSFRDAGGLNARALARRAADRGGVSVLGFAPWAH